MFGLALWPSQAVEISLALMHLLADWVRARKLEPAKVLTVDHGLVAGSRKHAGAVEAAAKSLGLDCAILVWKGTKPNADIEAAAREARYRLMGDWCRTNQIEALFVAHTEDDQAETFLLRLARGSGLDGLSAMRAIAPYPAPGFAGLSLVRPLLGFTRTELRALLTARNIARYDDPMNHDPRFARVRLRAILPMLEQAGLSARRIAAGAKHLARAREALEQGTADLIARTTRAEGRRLLIDAAALVAAPRELGLRALADLLMKVGGQPYRPRFEQLELLFDALAAGRFAARTLHGCRLGAAPKRLTVFGSRTVVLAMEPARNRQP